MALPPGRTSNEFPVLRKCGPLAAIIKTPQLPSSFKMRQLVVSTFLCTLLFSCTDNRERTKEFDFDNFVFSHSELHSDYSIKFAQSDTVYFGKRFPKPTESFYAIIGKHDLTTLDSFLIQFHISNYDTTYIQDNLSDGSSYKFYLTTDTSKKWVFIYGKEGPNALYEFANWLTGFEARQTFKPTEIKADYGDLNYILLPQVPPPPKE